MQPRRFAPDPAVEYFLDCAAEAGEMDACSHMTLRLYGNDAAILAIINPVTTHFRERRQKCLRLAALADDILPLIPEKRRGGLIRAGFHSCSYELLGLAEVLAGWAMEDSIEGGCLDPWKDRPRNRNGVTFKRTDRRLRSPKFMRNYVKKEGPDVASHLIDLTKVMLTRAARWGVDHDPSVRRDYLAQLNHRAVLTRAKNRRKAKAERKMIVRSLSTAISVLGRETVSAFVRGEEVRLIGEQTMLTIRKRGSLSDFGHGCLSVGMADRSGARLADLCTYIEGTPTLDQLTGFALWMAAGEEEAVLQRANIVTLEPAGRNHPLLVKRAAGQRGAAVQELAQMLGPDAAARVQALVDRPERRRGGLTWDEKRARNQSYWEETKGEWIEALLVLVVGYRNLPVFKQAEAL